MVRSEIKEKLQGMEGHIVNFRVGNRNPRFDQLILDFDLPDSVNPDDLIGLQVTVGWKAKEFHGKIYRKHGKSHVRARFRKPLPGQVVVPGEASVTID